ncbi:hypothetical protein [Anaerolinea thermolimosa]|uniref:hypothetical protein n=1 Tax=Anaerolinea thermolimosa TaxID=229919 RepID=UPI0009FC7300
MVGWTGCAADAAEGVFRRKRDPTAGAVVEIIPGFFQRVALLTGFVEFAEVFLFNGLGGLLDGLPGTLLQVEVAGGFSQADAAGEHPPGFVGQFEG